MSMIEWIFGKDDIKEYERIRSIYLTKVQEAVDIYHRQLDNMCGCKAKHECGDCYYRDIPEGEEWLYDKCPNYKDRCDLRNRLNLLCDELKNESSKEMSKAFYECRCFIWRPWFKKVRLELNKEKLEKKQ